MRVVEPHQFNKIKKQRTKRSFFKPVVKLALVITVVAGGLYVLAASQTKPLSDANKTTEQQTPEQSPQTPKTGTNFKQFSGVEFKELYLKTSYPNTQQLTEPPTISGNRTADDRIRSFAEARGYQLSSIPKASIVKIDEPRLDGDDLLQPLAADAWQSLKAAAHAEKYPLSIISAYRPPEYQRDLFMQRLLDNGTTVNQIAAGGGEAAIIKTLSMTAVPGYSRHHTGYTIDLWCEDGSGLFLKSKCYEWIRANNYLNAKKSGWIPSYPDDADMQGPEPEPWEYVWVGTQSLLE